MQTENIEKQETSPVPVWRCKDPECKAWMREELVTTANPVCPLCSSSMIRGMRVLPKLVKKHKRPRKSSITLH